MHLICLLVSRVLSTSTLFCSGCFHFLWLTQASVGICVARLSFYDTSALQVLRTGAAVSFVCSCDDVEEGNADDGAHVNDIADGDGGNNFDDGRCHHRRAFNQDYGDAGDGDGNNV